MYDGYIHSYGSRPPGRIPAMLELCGTGKHPNINVETQIPLELMYLHILSFNLKVSNQLHKSPKYQTIYRNLDFQLYIVNTQGLMPYGSTCMHTVIKNIQR